MRRDMKLILRILRCIRSRKNVEDEEFGPTPDFEPEVPEGKVRYHSALCVQAGYVEKKRDSNKYAAPASRLTWQGHDWIESQSDCGE